MSSLSMLFYAFAAGLTLSGIAASLLEIANGGRVSLRPPFLRRGKLLTSFGVTLAAGPYMLGNEALAARREGMIGHAAMAFWIAIAAMWALGCGIIVVELALAAASAFS